MVDITRGDESRARRGEEVEGYNPRLTKPRLVKVLGEMDSQLTEVRYDPGEHIDNERPNILDEFADRILELAQE